MAEIFLEKRIEGKYEPEAAALDLKAEFNELNEVIYFTGEIDGGRRLGAALRIDEIPKRARIAITQQTIEELLEKLLKPSEQIQES